MIHCAEELANRAIHDPLLILEVATSIAQNRGQLPSVEVTRLCRLAVPRLLEAVDPRDVRDALEKCLLRRDVDAALEWLYEIGFIDAYLPELAATRDLQQEAGRRHKDVWEHSKLVVRQSVPRPAVRWASLLHDIGKVPTRTFTAEGVHFHGHAEVGARMFDKVSRRIPFEPAMRKKIRFLIKHHLRSNQYSADWSDAAVRRFAREMDIHLVDLLDLSRADITSRRPGRRKFLLKQICDLSARIDELRKLDEKEPPLPTGLGSAIMAHFGLEPSRQVGELKRALEQAVERGELEQRREDEYYIRWLEERGHVLNSKNSVTRPRRG
jgi:poly(A) polymerase